MKEQKIEIPRFNQLEKLILDAQSTVDSDHSPLLKNLTRAQKAIIKEILTEEVSANNKNNPGLKYQVSYLKTLPHSPSLTDLHRSLEQYRQIKTYYFAFNDLYPSLAMKDEGFKKVAIEFMKMLELPLPDQKVNGSEKTKPED